MNAAKIRKEANKSVFYAGKHTHTHTFPYGGSAAAAIHSHIEFVVNVSLKTFHTALGPFLTYTFGRGCLRN